MRARARVAGEATSSLKALGYPCVERAGLVCLTPQAAEKLAIEVGERRIEATQRGGLDGVTS
jgi:hypothetical protein